MVRCRRILPGIENRVKELHHCDVRLLDRRKIESHLGELDQLDKTLCNGFDSSYTHLACMKIIYTNCVSETCHSFPEYFVEIYRR